jgi:hypothetical protein
VIVAKGILLGQGHGAGKPVKAPIAQCEADGEHAYIPVLACVHCGRTAMPKPQGAPGKSRRERRAAIRAVRE